MKKISLFVSLILVFFTAAATAHGPVRGKLTATTTIDASADKVWDVISNYDDMSWHPAISNATADNGNKKGSVRVLTLTDGGFGDGNNTGTTETVEAQGSVVVASTYDDNRDIHAIHIYRFCPVCGRELKVKGYSPNI